MSELTEKIEKLERENEELKNLPSGTRNQVNALQATIRVIKEEIPGDSERIARIVSEVVTINL